jgi:hypothetical protein
VLMAGANVGETPDGGTLESATVWSGAPDRTWALYSTGAGGEATRSAFATALGTTVDATGAPDGFLLAEQTYDASGSPTAVGQTYSGHSAVSLLFSADGKRFTAVTKRVPGMDSAAVVMGVAQGADRLALVGMKRDGTCGVWVVDPAAIR